MYFLNLRGLSERLARGPLTAFEGLRYAFGLFLLYRFPDLLRIANPSGSVDGWRERLVGALVVTVVMGALVWWLLKAFWRDGGGDRMADFLPNLMAILFVVTCQVSLVTYPVLIVAFVATQLALAGEDPSWMTVATSIPVALVIAIGGLVYCYRAIRGAFREIARRRATSDLVNVP